MRHVPVSLEVRSFEGPECDAIPIEVLSENLSDQYADQGIRFFKTEEILELGVATRALEGLKLLGAVQTVLPTVCGLIRSLHLIDSADDEVDVSFSEPTLPFSAFVSVPGPTAVSGNFRVAEALLHEAMHLQLTLVEAIVPLVTSTERAYFSPWRNEHRTAQGVLHALYVFQVIDAFWCEASRESQMFLPARNHASTRRATIARQVREIREFRSCTELTSEGVAFVDRMLG
jgi:HEXXH motif-containing protein